MTDTDSWPAFFAALAIALLAALVLIVGGAVVSRIVGSRFEPAARLFHAIRNPYRVLVTVLAIVIAVVTAAPGPHTEANAWWDTTTVWLRIAVILASTWLIGQFVLYLEDLALDRYRTDVSDNRVARRMRTQVLIIRRLTAVAFVIIGIGASLLSFPGVQAVGASVLASAGLISVIAGLAAQSTLANLFAGLQLAFSDAIRIDDVVVVENEWGRIEEITLSYVVVHLWDDRRLVLPSTYFTTTPFANWTRKNSELLGAVEFDVDWRVDTQAMREELDAVLAESDLWDHRTGVLQVTDATGGLVRIRVLVSAIDAGTLFDLRCFVRERLVEWVQETAGIVPRQRVELVDELAHDTQHPHPASGSVPGLFSGSAEGEARATQFTGPIDLHDAAELADAEQGADRESGQPPSTARPPAER